MTRDRFGGARCPCCLGDMSGYTPDEKLRLQQLRELRRRWLKDQELSAREPVLPPQRTWPLERFWNKFLQNEAPWRKLVSDGRPCRGCWLPHQGLTATPRADTVGRGRAGFSKDAISVAGSWAGVWARVALGRPSHSAVRCGEEAALWKALRIA